MSANLCSRCSSTGSLTDHHVVPKCHWKSRKNRTTVRLCEECHFKIERVYEAIEMYIGGVPLGTRYRLRNEQYYDIVRHFLRKSRIVSMEF